MLTGAGHECIVFKVFIPIAETSIILQRAGSKLGNNVSNEPSHLRANDILASS